MNHVKDRMLPNSLDEIAWRLENKDYMFSEIIKILRYG
jgi:hypothetical protein